MSISSYGSTGSKSGSKLKFKGRASSGASAFAMLSSIFSNEENDEGSVADDDDDTGSTRLLTYRITGFLLISYFTR